MDLREEILSSLARSLKAKLKDWDADRYWEDAHFCRACLIYFRRGRESAWDELVERLEKHPRLLELTARLMLEEGCVFRGPTVDSLLLRSEVAGGIRPPGFERLMPLLRKAVEEDLPPRTYLVDRIHTILRIYQKHYSIRENPPAPADRTDRAKSEIMYLESKPGLAGPARIGRVHFSKTQKTIYYDGRAFQTMKGRGYKCNHTDVATGERYWISRCRNDGQDSLYPNIVEIDEDVRQEYWETIRARPDLTRNRSFRSEGKHSKRRPG